MSAPTRDGDLTVSRRMFLGASALAGALALPAGHAVQAAERRRVLRVAHLTDIHIQPEFQASQGLISCLHHLQSLPQKPDLILSGGDHVMDCYRQKRDRTQVQWDLWTNAIRKECSIPIRSCIGNHDIWGWDKAKSDTTGTEPEFGKNWACDVLGLARPYYSFSQQDWHFIALDSVRPGAAEQVFAAFLDDEQIDWLERDLASIPQSTPVLIWSHIPLVSAIPPLMNAGQSPLEDMTIECGHIHSDGARILALLNRYPNVKACISGHLHRIDHVQIKGVNFHCSGAVCGKWWRGANDGFSEGYSLIDLFSDGTYEWQYVNYGWNADRVTA